MTRSRKIEKSRCKIYLAKADEFFCLMKYAQEQKLWIGAGLNGIHCAISACDALTSFYFGERSLSSRHEDVVILLRRMNVENIESKINQVLSILSVKNLVEYEDREFRENDALKIVAQVERLYAWVKRFLPDQK
jgi:hypothetical protein